MNKEKLGPIKAALSAAIQVHNFASESAAATFNLLEQTQEYLFKLSSVLAELQIRLENLEKE